MKFPVIVCDPPWSFKSWSDKGKNRAPDAMVRQKGLAERHYATMDAETLLSLPLAAVSAKDCVLFLWAVDCMLPEAIELGRVWGFTFKTVAFTWAKQTRSKRSFHIGLGYWTRGNPEMCLLFTKGKPKRRSASVRQLIVSPRGPHSTKPDEFRDRIETLVDGPYLELFARPDGGMFGTRANWTMLGNEISGRDIREDLELLASG